MQKRKRSAISLLLALMMLLAPAVPAFADAGFAPAAFDPDAYDPYGYGPAPYYLQDFILTGDGGTPVAVPYRAYYVGDYGHSGSDQDLRAPLLPAYNMDWTPAGQWDLSEIYHQFEVRDEHYVSAGGLSPLTSADALDCTSGRQSFEIYTTMDALAAQFDVTPYLPRLAYDGDAITGLRLSSSMKRNEAWEINAAIDDGTVGGPGAMPPFVWPEYVEPSSMYWLDVQLATKAAVLAGTSAGTELQLAIVDSSGAAASVQEITGDTVYTPFPGIIFKPGEYSLELYYLVELGGGVEPMRVEAGTLAKFEVEDYGDFKTFSINGVDGVISRDGDYVDDWYYGGTSSIRVDLPSGSAITALKPEFTLADGAVATWEDWVTTNPAVEVSGVSEHDFTNVAYYNVESKLGIRSVRVEVSTIEQYNLTGELKYLDDDGVLTYVPAGAEFDLYNCYNEKIGTITAIGLGRFECRDFAYSNRLAELGFLIGGNIAYGSPIEAVNGKVLQGGRCLIYPDQYAEITLGKTHNGGYVFRGRAVDDSNNPVEGAVANWDGVNWATSGALGGFQFDFDNHWGWESYGFMLKKEGYQSGGFNVSPLSSESVRSMIQNGYIDLGDIKLKKLPDTSTGADISVYASPSYTQRGKNIEVALKYDSDVAVTGAEIKATVPDGVEILDGTQTAGTVNGNSLTLTSDLAAYEDHKLIFWIRAGEAFTDEYFNIEAELRNGSALLDRGAALVLLSEISIDAPAEIGIDAGNSKPFNIMGETVALEGYTIEISATDLAGVPHMLKNGESASPTYMPIIGIDAAFRGPWYRVNDVSIENVGTSGGAFILTAVLKDKDGVPVEKASRVILVSENPLTLKSIFLDKGNGQVWAVTPVSNSSYVAASVFVNSNYSGRYDLQIVTDWENISDLQSARYILKTNLGTYTQSVATAAGITELAA
ncbi:MAG: hypothetical protein LBH39_07020, partial [Clostridiales Family XIII bacterium]|nr:hypothetical protein [Clostridiales Family XIII bacterium]